MRAGIILLVMVVVIVVAAAVYLWVNGRSRRAQLKDRFGAEYDRTVERAEDREQAEAELVQREERHAALDIRELDPATCTRYRDRWTALQSRFLDEPGPTVLDADRLVTEVMRDRGYPMEGFEQRAADISVEHSEVVANYRAAHDIAVRVGQDTAHTEDLRQAIIHYRSLFDDLLTERNATP